MTQSIILVDEDTGRNIDTCMVKQTFEIPKVKVRHLGNLYFQMATCVYCKLALTVEEIKTGHCFNCGE